MKKNGFTLAEVLLAVGIIGVIAILALPSLNKNINNKSRMTLLKGTIASITNVIQSEMTKSRTTEITLTDIYNDPEKFLEKFDTADTGEAFAQSYQKHSGGAATGVIIPENSSTQAKALLRNGVGIGIVNNLFDQESTGIILDLNGEDKPNMVGVDYFILQVMWKDGDGVHSGDVGSYYNGGEEDSSIQESDATLRAACKSGNGAACFRMVELSGYEPNYLQ